MASPHAAGVAALIVSRFGFGSGGGYGLSPRVTESVLRLTATRHACPGPRAFTYVRHLPSGQTVTATHTCEGPRYHNGFYGNGIVNAPRAVRPLGQRLGWRTRLSAVGSGKLVKRSLAGSKRTSALAAKSLSHTMSRSSTYTA